MAEQEQVKLTKNIAAQESISAVKNSQVETSRTDELLDEIDAVLEKNAAEFVKGFVQKGGQ